MLLCLDIGNSHIFGGLFVNDKIQLRFRHNVSPYLTSDQLGLFLRGVIGENGHHAGDITQITISSVVPSLDYSMRAACKKYFSVEPLFLKATDQSLVKLAIDYPDQLGSDLIAGAIAATRTYPNKNLIIVDFGTATTFALMTEKREYLGSVIAAGMRLSMESLQNNTANLSAVEIARPECAIGKNTKESIQAGSYYGHLGMIKEILNRLKTELGQNDCLVIATGGFAYLFEKERLFNQVNPDLLLDGLRYFTENS